MNRREFLRLGVAGAAGAVTPLSPVAIPRVNGGIVVNPVRRFETNAGFTLPLIVPRLVDLQMRLVYELGFSHMRIMISFEEFGPNFLAAIPYVRAARALGIDVLGIIDQFSGFDLARAISDGATRDEVLETWGRLIDRSVAGHNDLERGRHRPRCRHVPDGSAFAGVWRAHRAVRGDTAVHGVGRTNTVGEPHDPMHAGHDWQPRVRQLRRRGRRHADPQTTHNDGDTAHWPQSDARYVRGRPVSLHGSQPPQEMNS